MSQFFNSWNELAVSPESSALRNSVLNASQNLSDKIGNIFEEFELVRTDILNQYDTRVVEINSLLNNIKELNDTIYTNSVNGADPNDLLDRRDADIESLGKLVNITVNHDNRGAAIVNVGGITAVNNAYSMQFNGSIINGKLTLVSTVGGQPISLSGGEIYALDKLYSEKIPKYESDLNAIMNRFYTSVNSIHSTGYSTSNPQQTGINFFESYSDGSLVINPDILANVKMIAVSADGSSGNGDLANSIAALANQKLIDGETFSDKYNSLINRIGSDVLSNKRQVDSTKLILDQLINQRALQSGVSLDEEMANILKFQRSYDAAAKLIQIANEMLDSLMNII